MNPGVIKHHFKVFKKFIQFAFMTQISFRANFLFGYIIDVGWLFFMIAFFKIFYLHVPSIAGWTYYQILILLATYEIYTTLIYGLAVIFNFRRLPRKIWNGELDFYLLKPINSQFHISLKEIWPSIFLNLIFCVYLLYLGLSGLRGGFNLLNLFFYILSCLAGIFIVYSLWFMVICLAFFTEKLENIPYLPQGTIDYIIEYPIDIFKGRTKFFLTWFIPLAFACSFPARILMGSLSPIYTFYGLILAIFFLWFSNRFWNFCLKRYSSASS